jgi:hypothetical protein
MIVLVQELVAQPDDAEFTKHVISKILADHRGAQ